jgi:hypothetical protein
MVEQAPPAASNRSRTRLLVQGVLSLVLVVAIFNFLRKKIDPAQMWAAMGDGTSNDRSAAARSAAWMVG